MTDRWDVVATASVIARVRADEAHRPPAERLFEDPYAALFAAGPEIDALFETFTSVPFFGLQVRLRTRAIDDFLRTGLDEGIRQILLLGAGFDSRALRLDEIRSSGATVFEVDLERQLRSKSAKLADAGIPLPPFVRFVDCDFAETGWQERLTASLRDAGLRALPALFVCEGVISYLTDDQLDALLAWVATATAAGSRLVVNYPLARITPVELRRRALAHGFADVEDESMATLHAHHLGREAPEAGNLFHLCRLVT